MAVSILDAISTTVDADPSGDVVISANKKPVKDVKSLQKLAKEKSDRLLLQIVRGPGSLFIFVS